PLILRLRSDIPIELYKSYKPVKAMSECLVFQLIQAFLSAKCVLSGMNAEKIINVDKTLRDEAFPCLSKGGIFHEKSIKLV
ncbi:MAG: hypothetical protein IJ730_05260, partial [Alphaproteobacteria bacterium]|nr:hypothetical protein [Alphaproteobacteria bacterium]